MKPRIVIAGLGETGRHLAARLCLEWDLVAIDRDGALQKEDAICTACQCTVPDVIVIEGDATSALVLAEALKEPAHAAIACLSTDQANLEFLKLVKERHHIGNRFALLRDPELEGEYHEAGVEIVEQAEASARSLAQKIPRSHTAATGIGLGMGEILETEVLPGSGVIGRTLMELHPKRWLVAAIYRGKDLVVPHGSSTLEEGDRVVLVGDPEILPDIATMIRAGDSEFPLQFGSHVILLGDDGVDELVDESLYLVKSTKADALEIISCRTDEDTLKEVARRCDVEGVSYEFSCCADNARSSLLHEASKSDVGILVCPHEAIGPAATLGLRRTSTAATVSLLDSPALISRRTHPYSKILLAVSEVPFPPRAIQLAVDAARIFSADLHVALVHEPELVVGAHRREEIEAVGKDLTKLAGLFGLNVEIIELSGNPVREVVPLSESYDLLITTMNKKKPPFLSRPDTGVNLIHRCRCSVLVFPY